MDDKAMFDLHVFDEHGIDIGKLNTVSEVLKYVNETGYVKISGYFNGTNNKKITFDLTLNCQK